MCDAEAEQQSDVEDTSQNASLSQSQSQLDTSTEDALQTSQLKSPRIESVEQPAQKIASPVQQVIIYVA